MKNGSPEESPKKDDFLGLYVTSEMKERVERKADEEGVSISETVRRRLKDIGGPRPAIT